MSKHKTPYSYTHSFLSKTKHLGKIRRLGYKQFLYILLYVNSLKKFFVNKAKFNYFKKMSNFSNSLLPKILKLSKSSLKSVFLLKIVRNQFLFKNFTSYVSYDWFSLIWNLLYLIGSQRGVWKREKQAIIDAEFSK